MPQQLRTGRPSPLPPAVREAGRGPLRGRDGDRRPPSRPRGDMDAFTDDIPCGVDRCQSRTEGGIRPDLYARISFHTYCANTYSIDVDALKERQIMRSYNTTGASLIEPHFRCDKTLLQPRRIRAHFN